MQHRPGQARALLWSSEAPSRNGKVHLGKRWDKEEVRQQSSGPGAK